MNDFTFETVWPEPRESVQAEVVDFWLAESAMPEGAAQERAKQLLVVTRDPNASVAAVSTAFPHFVVTLGLRCFYFRAFIGRTNRTKGLLGSKLIHHLLRQSYDVLNERFQFGIDQDVFGLYLEVQNSSILRHRRELVWTDLGANIVLTGFLPTGGQTRVWYFEDGKVPR